MADISQMLSIPAVDKGVGSSVHNDFIDPLVSAVLGEELADVLPDKYRKIQAVIEALGGVYTPADPDYPGRGHTSEGTRSGGGGTLTNYGLGTIRDLLMENGVPLLQWDSDPAPQEELEEGYSPSAIIDHRVRRQAIVATRPGATQFREQVRDAYRNECCVSGSNLTASLEAAHIAPYMGPDSDRVDNALLLRADLHKLHDALLIAVSDEDLTVLAKPMVIESTYGEYVGQRIAEPLGVALSREALRFHRQRCGL
jgi:hypothetical protein